MTEDDEADFCALAAARAPALRRTAYALCGDWHLAEDLVQQALVKAYLSWPPRERSAAAGYLRQILLRTCTDSFRRPWWRREQSTDAVPDVRGVSDDYPHDQGPLLDALRRVPPRQRACIVLRHLEDLSVEDTAALLRCSTGTVKSQTARGLDALRRELGSTPDLTPTPGGLR
ncbi:SigE family RNA polymerase sigma factor [Kineococcus sp. NUM-3379]